MITAIDSDAQRAELMAIMQADGQGKHWIPHPTHYMSDDGTLETLRGAFTTLYAPLALVWLREASKSFSQGLFYVRNYPEMEAIIDAEVKRRNPDVKQDLPIVYIIENDSPVIPYIKAVNLIKLDGTAFTNLKGVPHHGRTI